MSKHLLVPLTPLEGKMMPQRCGTLQDTFDEYFQKTVVMMFRWSSALTNFMSEVTDKLRC